VRALACGALLLAAGGAGAAPGYADRPEVRAFVREMTERHGFVPRELEFLFSRARRQDAVLQAIEPQPPGERSWQAYRDNFVSPRRIEAGLAFWRAHARSLARARRDYGVPEEVIVAILGVETFYGRNQGRWRVVDALTTLAFDYPPRAEFFRGELENFLLFAREGGFEVFSLYGSYAGAIGIPQFMPGSYLRYAVDFDGDGRADLRASAADAIGSVANFLQRHGWKPGEPAEVEAQVTGDAFRRYADGGMEPRFAVGELLQAGVRPAGALPPETHAALIELETPQQPSAYRLGLQNFYVLTRYNRSAFYAAAVSDLARELRARR